MTRVGIVNRDSVSGSLGGASWREMLRMSAAWARWSAVSEVADEGELVRAARDREPSDDGMQRRQDGVEPGEERCERAEEDPSGGHATGEHRHLEDEGSHALGMAQRDLVGDVGTERQPAEYDLRRSRGGRAARRRRRRTPRRGSGRVGEVWSTCRGRGNRAGGRGGRGARPPVAPSSATTWSDRATTPPAGHGGRPALRSRGQVPSFDGWHR